MFLFQFIVAENSSEQLQNINTTYLAYKRIVDYCQQHPTAAEKVQRLTCSFKAETLYLIC